MKLWSIANRLLKDTNLKYTKPLFFFASFYFSTFLSCSSLSSRQFIRFIRAHHRKSRIVCIRIVCIFVCMFHCMFVYQISWDSVFPFFFNDFIRFAIVECTKRKYSVSEQRTDIELAVEINELGPTTMESNWIGNCLDYLYIMQMPFSGYNLVNLFLKCESAMCGLSTQINKFMIEYEALKRSPILSVANASLYWCDSPSQNRESHFQFVFFFIPK